MNKEWSLHVENFGKIKSADVRITPLMCIVGDNNSGKSYFMSLLWGILTLGKEIFPKAPSDAKTYIKCEKWLREHVDCQIELGEEEIKLYITWFNELLSSNKERLLTKIFNYNIDADIIEITKYKRKKKLKIMWDENAERYSVTESYIKFPKLETYSREMLLRMNAYICWNILMEGIAEPLYTPIIKGRRMGEPVYLPASRTGFMLTYPQLIENSLQISFAPASQGNATALTLPYVDFLQLITKFETGGRLNKRNAAIVHYIEGEMTRGNILVKKDMIPVIKYRPEGKNQELPLYVSSSIITEVSPLLLLFTSNINFKTLIIEEPEAHLHPELQQKMARLLIRLANEGMPVWITTHSDTILQHFNNMLKLNRHKQKNHLMQEFAYERKDLLNESMISMYQFSEDTDGYSRLEVLESTEYGFVVPTFNDALDKMVREVYAFQEEENV